MKRQGISERDLVVLAKRFRRQAGKTRAQAAREMEVSQTSIFNAEESPQQSLARLRERMNCSLGRHPRVARYRAGAAASKIPTCRCAALTAVVPLSGSPT